MKALTLHQPWASLIAVGAKRIETRSWSTKYRGPLAIHAGKVFDHSTYPDLTRHLFRDDEPGVYKVPSDPPVPLGAVVATCRLVDVVPMVDAFDAQRQHERPFLAISRGEGRDLSLWLPDDEAPFDAPRMVSDQLPFGDFSPGRFAWILDDVKPTTERCPACWGRGWDKNRRGAVAFPGDECATCRGSGGCAPVPARGKQGLWNWEAA